MTNGDHRMAQQMTHTHLQHTFSGFQPLLLWLIYAAIMGCFVWVVYDQGVLVPMLSQDATRISALVLLLLSFTTVYAGYRAYFLSLAFRALAKDLKHSHTVVLQLAKQTHTSLQHQTTTFNSLAAPYFRALHQPQVDVGPLSELVAEQVGGSHRVGWFCAGLMIKLGLLGTVAGFILMLASLDSLDALDASRVTELMTEMTQGMEVAMNTTLVGLTSSILLSIQFLGLDRCADRYMAITLAYGEQLTRAASCSDTTMSTPTRSNKQAAD